LTFAALILSRTPSFTYNMDAIPADEGSVKLGEQAIPVRFVAEEVPAPSSEKIVPRLYAEDGGPVKCSKKGAPSKPWIELKQMPAGITATIPESVVEIVTAQQVKKTAPPKPFKKENIMELVKLKTQAQDVKGKSSAKPVLEDASTDSIAQRVPRPTTQAVPFKPNEPQSPSATIDTFQQKHSKLFKQLQARCAESSTQSAEHTFFDTLTDKEKKLPPFVLPSMNTVPGGISIAPAEEENGAAPLPLALLGKWSTRASTFWEHCVTCTSVACNNVAAHEFAARMRRWAVKRGRKHPLMSV
jgi:hypothetical protein